jgi:hypothetical protein
MGKHFEFVDLPITQFLIGDGILYGTIFAHYALQTGINILGGKINDEIVNRIIKYINRGYYFVNMGDQPIGQLKDLSLKITRVYLTDSKYSSKLHEYKVNTNLKDFEFMLKAHNNVIDRYHFDKKYPNSVTTSSRTRNISYDQIINLRRQTYYDNIVEAVSSNTSYSNIFKLMEQMDVIDKTVHSRTIQKIKTERRKVYHDMDYYDWEHHRKDYHYIIDDIIEIRNIIETKFKLNMQKQYKYKDDERKHSAYQYEYWLKSKRDNNNKPFYQVLTISQFCNVPNLIFFKEFTSYFLNKNDCKIGIDDNFYPLSSSILEKKVNFYCRTLKKPIVTSDDDGFILVTKKRQVKKIS